MKNKKLVLINNEDYNRYKDFFEINDDFFIDKVYCFNRNNNYFFKIINHFNLNPYSHWKKDLNQYDYVVIFDWAYSKKLIKYIKNKNKKIKVIIWFWNTISDYVVDILNDKLVDEFYTFCPDDAQKYNINYLHQFYFDGVKKYNSTADNNTSDIYFVGQNKGRKKTLDELHDYFLNNNIVDNIIIIDDCNAKKFITYNENIDNVFKTKCVLEITNKNIDYITLRCLEALCTGRKLITDNKSIKKYDFFNDNNIFVLDNNIEEIPNFLEKAYVNIDKKIIDKYSFSNWISKIK